jgi:hypothetical protein
MELAVTPTEHFFMDGNVMVRMWQGTARHPNGTEEACIALVAAVAFTGHAETFASGLGLVSIPPPTGLRARAWAAEVLSKRYEDDENA